MSTESAVAERPEIAVPQKNWAQVVSVWDLTMFFLKVIGALFFVSSPILILMLIPGAIRDITGH